MPSFWTPTRRVTPFGRVGGLGAVGPLRASSSPQPAAAERQRRQGERRGQARDRGRIGAVLRWFGVVRRRASTPSRSSSRRARRPARGGRGGAGARGRRARRRRSGPSSMSSTRSASTSASSTSCVTSSTAGWWRCQSRLTSVCAETRVSASSALNGSSSSIRSGSRTSARASATRWRWPPESWRGHASSRPSRPTSANARRARAAGSARAGRARRSAITLRHGISRGSWKTTAGVPPVRSSPVDPAVEPGERAQQRRLARPRAAQQGDELARRDVQVEPVEHASGRRSAVQAAQADDGLGGGRARSPAHASSLQRSARRSNRRTSASVSRPEHGVGQQADHDTSVRRKSRALLIR